MTRHILQRQTSFGVVPQLPQRDSSAASSALMISAPLVAAFAFTLALQGQPNGQGLQLQFDAGLPDAGNVLPMRPQTPPPVLDLTEVPSEKTDVGSSSAYGQAASGRSGDRAADPRERVVR